MSAVAIALVVVLLDGVDGWVARRTRTASAFGERFDLETDAALILVLAILAWQYGKAGPWVLLSGLLRYLFVAAGWLWPWMGAPLASSLRGKTVCVVQIVALIVAIAPPITPPTSGALLFISGRHAEPLAAYAIINTCRTWDPPSGGFLPSSVSPSRSFC
ncbi:MAG: hypothetical protein DMF89_19515 [Acidobacteria bacterium]|nr:MAG: hypothetical protein DMF89_19515 [Acidobacteriota bacterium]